MYSDEPFDWDESDQKALRAYADLGESSMVGALYAHEQGRVVQQLEGALESRVVIERAVGVLMGNATTWTRSRRSTGCAAPRGTPGGGCEIWHRSSWTVARGRSYPSRSSP